MMAVNAQTVRLFIHGAIELQLFIAALVFHNSGIDVLIICRAADDLGLLEHAFQLKSAAFCHQVAFFVVGDAFDDKALDAVVFAVFLNQFIHGLGDQSIALKLGAEPLAKVGGLVALVDAVKGNYSSDAAFMFNQLDQ